MKTLTRINGSRPGATYKREHWMARVAGLARPDAGPDDPAPERARRDVAGLEPDPRRDSH